MRLVSTRLGSKAIQRLRLRHLVDDDLVSRSVSSGMRWRVWMTVASAVCVVVRHRRCGRRSCRMETALVVSSAPWSITFSVSFSPSTDAVTWMPPVPQPYGNGISREPNGT
jgi:hypothetical protein